MVKEAASVGGVAGGAAGGEFGGVGVGEEGVEVMDGLGRADAAKRGEDDGEEGAALSDAASEVFVVFLEGAAIKEVGGADGGGGGVGGEEGTGDGDVDGGDGGGAVVSGNERPRYFFG